MQSNIITAGVVKLSVGKGLSGIKKKKQSCAFYGASWNGNMNCHCETKHNY